MWCLDNLWVRLRLSLRSSMPEPPVLWRVRYGRMRYVLLVMTVGASLQGQAIMDATAAAAGGIAGGAAGKKVNDGLNKVLGNVATQTAKAAGDAKPKAVAVVQAPTVPVLAAAPAAPAPFLELSPGVPKSGGVPLPPAAPHKLAMERPAPLPVPPPVVVP